MSRHYPGFLAAFFIVLLRVAIGWHFLYRGSARKSSRPGPARSRSRPRSTCGTRPVRSPLTTGACCPTSTAWRLLDPAQAEGGVERRRDADRRPLRVHPGTATARPRRSWTTVFTGPTTGSTIPKTARSGRSTSTTCGRFRRPSKTPMRSPTSANGPGTRAGSLDADRRALTQPLRRARARHLMIDAVAKLATARSTASGAGPPPPRYTNLDLINDLTMYGLIAIGLCLIAGFLTPLAALSAAAFLAMIYFSMPPWPGMPPNPKAEGHYLYRQQEPGRADRLPGDRHDAQRPLDRPRCTLLRRPPPSPAGADEQAQARSRVGQQDRDSSHAGRAAGHRPRPQADSTGYKSSRQPSALIFDDKERPMTHLTPEERVLGRENANQALGVSRRDLLKAAAATPALGAFYFGYEDMKGKSPVKRRDHRHRRRRLPGHDPLAQPRLSRLHRLLRHPPLAARAGHQGILQSQRLHRRRRQEAQALRDQGGDVRRPRRRDDRDRAAPVAARAGGDRGDEDRASTSSPRS